MMSLGGFHPCPVGTPSKVADVFEQWIEDGDVDGFNIAYINTPGSQEDIVDLLVPELVRRGRMWDDYDVQGGSLRENLYGVKGMAGLPDDHYGSKFKYPSEFKGDSMEEYESQEVDKSENKQDEDVSASAKAAEATPGQKIVPVVTAVPVPEKA